MLEKADRSSHGRIDEKARPVNVASSRAAEERNSIRYLLALSGPFDWDNGRDHALDLWVLLQLDIEERGAHPGRAHCVDSNPLRGMIKS